MNHLEDFSRAPYKPLVYNRRLCVTLDWLDSVEALSAYSEEDPIARHR